MSPWRAAQLGLPVAVVAALLLLLRGSEIAQLTTLQAGEPLGPLPRMGLNLGGRNAWGADQLMANVLQNPGLEPVHDGALLVIGRSDGLRVEDDQHWTARQPGFWVGAHYELLSGASAGTRGRVLDNSGRRGAAGPDQLQLAPMPAGLQPGDVIALQGQQDGTPAPMWWPQGKTASVAQPRPGSPGQHALRLSASPSQPAALHHHLDALGKRAGKLLPINGRWRLSLWLRAIDGAPRLQLSFGRHGHTAWLREEVEAGPDWQHLHLDFDAHDSGPMGPLQLSLSISQGELLLDDVELSPEDAGVGGFRREVVQTLQALRPGYLRDWQGQLGDSLDNRLAAPLARRPMRYRTGPGQQIFAYGLPEFLELCAAIQARPWLVLPATITPEDAARLGRWLRQAWERHGFDEIVVEHGNEHWNTVFRPAGIAQPGVLGAVADRAFAALRSGAGQAVPLHRVLGAQYVNSHAGQQLVTASQHSEGIAVAPYFHYRQDRSETLEEALHRAFDEGMQDLQRWRDVVKGRRSLDVYEVNFHTTGGNASPEQRHAVLEHPSAAGALLARRLIHSALLGVRRQAVYSLAGYDTPMEGDSPQLVRLFGITQDLATPAKWRPGGQALVELNAAMDAGGEVRGLQCSGPACDGLSGLVFGGVQNRRWFLVSSARQPQLVHLPCSSPLQLRLPGNPIQHLTLPCKEGQAQLQMPGWSWASIHR